jgi:hypothetical protein
MVAIPPEPEGSPDPVGKVTPWAKTKTGVIIKTMTAKEIRFFVFIFFITSISFYSCFYPKRQRQTMRQY